MNIFVSGINYKSTPLDMREKLSFTADQQKQVLDVIKEIKGVKECVFLSTCNRTEAYIYTDSCIFNNERVEKLLCDIKLLNIYDFKKYFYFYSSVQAVKHLFNVTCGLDSMVLGEDQILGQVKCAFEVSLETRASAGILNTLFRNAITAAKEIKTYTNLSKNNLSVASLAVKFIYDYYNENLEDKRALLIGAGKIGGIALKNLIDKEIKKIYVTNRTHGKSKELSKENSIEELVDYHSRYLYMNECDIIISSTSSPHYTITKDMLEKSLGDSKQRVFIDLAVPRDIDIAIQEIEGVKYFNMDDLQLSVDENIDKRLLEVPRAEEIIEKYILEYEKWYEFRSILPVIKDIQKYTDEMVNEKVNLVSAKMKSSSEEDKDIVKAVLTNTVNELINKFVYSIRESGNKEDIEAYFRCLGEVMKNDEI